MTDTLVLKNKLVMPQEGTYLELDQDEMEYVDGGVVVYKGQDAWFQITGMIAGSMSWYALSIKCIAAVTGGVLTFYSGIGTLLAILGFYGYCGTFFMGTWNAVQVIAAIMYTVQDGGFKEKGWSLFGFGFNIIERL